MSGQLKPKLSNADLFFVQLIVSSRFGVRMARPRLLFLDICVVAWLSLTSLLTAQSPQPPVGDSVPESPTPATKQTALPAPPAIDAAAVEAAQEDPPPSDADFETPSRETSFPTPLGTALQRQSSSVQRQLGRARQGQGSFFVSSWFSDNPVNPQASTGKPTSSENCEPLDNTIAEAFMRESATRQGVSLDLVREVVRHESGFHPCAVSPKGAAGMMQLMPDTAMDLGVVNPFDARENIDGGVRLLRRLLDKYKGRPDLALAAYNAGEGAVDIANGVPDFAETKEYVSSIMRKVFETPPNRPVRSSIQRTGVARTPPDRTVPPQRQPGQSIETPAPPAAVISNVPSVGTEQNAVPPKAVPREPALQ